MDDKPEVRIGTSERERAQSALSEHFSEGRLDMPEFEERSSLAAAARTVGDLAAVFIDLPGGLPDLTGLDFTSADCSACFEFDLVQVAPLRFRY